MRKNCAEIQYSPNRTNPEYLVIVRDMKGREIFTASYSAKHKAEQAAAILNRCNWLVAA